MAEEMLAAVEFPAIEDVVMMPTETHQVLRVPARRETAHPRRLDMRTVSPRLAAPRDKTLDALAQHDRLGEFKIGQHEIRQR